jgi:hypothetical protein
MNARIILLIGVLTAVTLTLVPTAASAQRIVGSNETVEALEVRNVAVPSGLSIIAAMGVGVAILEQETDLVLDDAIGNIPLRNQSSAARVSVESQTVGKQIRGEALRSSGEEAPRQQGLPHPEQGRALADLFDHDA